MHKQTVSCLSRATVLLLAVLAHGHASSILFAGVDTDLGSGWRTGVVPNSLFSGGYLGGDGYYTFGSQGVLADPTADPSYFTNIAMASAVYPGNAGYALIDNPLTTPGSSTTIFLSGTLNPFPGTNLLSVDFSFQLAAQVPSTFRIGLMIDNLDIANYNPYGLRVIQTNGKSPAVSALVSTSGSQFNDRIPDWLFFDIQGVAGDTFAVEVSGGANGCACLGAISVDSETPEPSTFGVLGLGLACLAFAGLRRAAQSSSMGNCR
jgi:PEP-CTERM motif